MSATTTSHLVKLGEVIERLSSIARRLSHEGLQDEAKSIETTIADLDWQREELLEAVAETALSRSGS